MQRSQEHLLRVVNSVLAFLKVESGIGGDAEPRAFLPPDLLRGVHTLIAPQLEARKLAFGFKYEEPVTMVFADPARVQQIMLNLLSNAVKFTPSPGTITVETANDDGMVEIRARDTGVGIPADMMEAVFEPFVQAQGSASGETIGTGLGLPISRRLAEAMGGSLTVESVVGEGSKFTLRLPAAEPAVQPTD